MYKNTVEQIPQADRHGATAAHHLQTVWWTPATADQIWGALANYAAWPDWWRGIRSVEVLRRGDESGAGTVLRQQWRSWFPYTLVFDLEMLRIESKRLLDGRASGDLEGSCRWTLFPADNGTEIHFDVNVRTSRWWMNLPIPFAERVVRANFQAIMRWGRTGLAETISLPIEQRQS